MLLVNSISQDTKSMVSRPWRCEQLHKLYEQQIESLNYDGLKELSGIKKELSLL